MPLFRRESKPEPDLSLFFATDLHGSDVCFRKFLNARAAYDVDLMILGGDMTGKLAIPIVEGAGGRCTVAAPGGPFEIEASQLDDVREQLSRSGFYPFVTTPDEVEAYKASPALVQQTLDRLMRERLEQWAAWADDKLAGTGVSIFVAPGNDDPFEIDDVLLGLPRFRLVEGQVIRPSPDHPFEMLSTGFTNRTPWDTPREMEEESLAERFEKLVVDVEDPSRAIFNIHVPPYGSQLDNGPMLDWETMKLIGGIGQEVSVPVGSHACRAFLERHQPMLALHGHIHESRAVTRIGRTIAINPGSDYGDGILRGVIVRLSDEGAVLSHQLTSG